MWCVCVPSELESNERWLLTLLQGLSRFIPCLHPLFIYNHTFPTLQDDHFSVGFYCVYLTVNNSSGLFGMLLLIRWCATPAGKWHECHVIMDDTDGFDVVDNSELALEKQRQHLELIDV